MAKIEYVNEYQVSEYESLNVVGNVRKIHAEIVIRREHSDVVCRVLSVKN